MRKESILDGRVNLLVPGNLVKLTQDDLITAYSNERQRPDYIFEDKANGAKIAINYHASKASDKDLPEIKAYFEKLYQSMTHDFISSDYKSIKGKRFVVMQFELKDPNSDGKIYNYAFFTSLDGKLLLTDYSFPASQASKCLIQANAIIDSFQN